MKIFDPENPMMIFLSRIFELIVLNVCFVIACIPIFTIGPALTALNCVTLKMAEGDFGYTAVTFFDSFKKNFKQGTILWLILFSATLIPVSDLYLVFFKLGPEYKFLQYPAWLVLFFALSSIIYSFPMLSKFEQTNFQLIKNSILLSLGNIPLTIFIIVILGVILDLSVNNPKMRVIFFSIFLFIGCALLSRIFSIFIRRALAAAEKKD